MSKFLIIRFSSIGDIVLTTPVVRCLKRQVPGAEVHFLTKPAYRKILENNPYIDRLHLLSDDFDETVGALKAEHFDHIIDLHHSLRSLRVKCRLWPVRSVSFNKLFRRNRKTFLYVILFRNQTLNIFYIFCHINRDKTTGHFLKLCRSNFACKKLFIQCLQLRNRHSVFSFHSGKF